MRKGVPLNKHILSAPDRHTEHQPGKGAPKGLIVFTRKDTKKTPDWVPAFKDIGFDLGLESQHPGAIFCIRAKSRVFAIVFGTGHHSIDKSKIVPDFGLRAVANLIDPKRVEALNTRTISSRSFNTSQQSSGMSIRQYLRSGYALTKKIRGTHSTETDWGHISGSKSVSITHYSNRLGKIHQVCVELLAAFNKKLPDAFEFLDDALPLDRDDIDNLQLEQELHKHVISRSVDNLDLCLESEFMLDFKSGFLGSRNSTSIKGTTASITSASLGSILDAHQKLLMMPHHPKPENIYIDIQTRAGDQHLRKRLYDVFSTEVRIGSACYVKTDGHWYRVSNAFIDKVNRKLSKIEIYPVTGETKLDPWDQSKLKCEAAYNESLATKYNWILGDKKLLQRGLSKFEAYDLLTDKQYLIHVKIGGSSQAVSYLAAQINAASAILDGDVEWREKIADTYDTQWPSDPFRKTNLKFVAAIASTTGDIFSNLLVGKINFLEMVRDVRDRGHHVYITHIQYTPKPKDSSSQSGPSKNTHPQTGPSH